jgi:hypothetical protein
MINDDAHCWREGQELLSRPASLSRSMIGSAGLVVGDFMQNRLGTSSSDRIGADFDYRSPIWRVTLWPTSGQHPGRMDTDWERNNLAQRSRGAAAHLSGPACTPPGTDAAPGPRSGPGSSTYPHSRTPLARNPAPPPARPAGPGTACIASAAPLDTSAVFLPAASARRRWSALIRDTRNRLATSRSLAPTSISSAAPRRTPSQRPRSAAPPRSDPAPPRPGRRHRDTSCLRYTAPARRATRSSKPRY